jgi:hypothetical protein
MKFAVVVFPGSNCDHDAYYAAGHVLGQQAEYIWHKDTSLKGADVVILPGGFAHGDYLRTGAMARFSPIMRAVEAFAADIIEMDTPGPCTSDLTRLPFRNIPRPMWPWDPDLDEPWPGARAGVPAATAERAAR